MLSERETLNIKTQCKLHEIRVDSLGRYKNHKRNFKIHEAKLTEL